MATELFTVRVDHELGFFSFYDVMAIDKNRAEREAGKQFKFDFCDNKSQYKLEYYTFEATEPMYKGTKTLYA